MPKDKSTSQRAGSRKSPRGDQRTNPATRQTRTEQRLVARQAQQRRQRIVYAIAGVVALVLIAAVVLLFTNTPADAPIPESVARYEDIDQGMTDKGYARMGDLDGIAVTLYTTFACDECRVFHRDIFPALLERARSGQISLTYVPLRGGNISNANGATRSAICAGQQQQFFQYADALYSWIDAYGGDAFRDNRLTTGAANLGLNQARFDDCRRSAPENLAYSSAAVDLSGRGQTLTPPFVRVNGVDVEPTTLEAINAAIDAALDFRSGQNATGADAMAEPDATVVPEPTGEATAVPDEATPTAAPTDAATDEPTTAPTAAPTDEPAAEPTAADS